MHTSVAIDTKDFEEFMVEENLHVAIIAKDFKAVVTHADTAKASITARYIRPCRPLQLAYEFEGITCEFTLMTRGEASDEEPDSSRPPASALSARNTPRPVQTSTSRSVPVRGSMPPPASRPTQRPTQASVQAPRNISIPPSVSQIDHDSLFVPMDDDRQWDEPNYDDDTEDRLGWDATADQVGVSTLFPDVVTDIYRRRHSTQHLINESEKHYQDRDTTRTSRQHQRMKWGSRRRNGYHRWVVHQLLGTNIRANLHRFAAFSTE